jgi:hypothetical protein
MACPTRTVRQWFPTYRASCRWMKEAFSWVCTFFSPIRHGLVTSYRLGLDPLTSAIQPQRHNRQAETPTQQAEPKDESLKPTTIECGFHEACNTAVESTLLKSGRITSRTLRWLRLFELAEESGLYESSPQAGIRAVMKRSKPGRVQMNRDGVR